MTICGFNITWTGIVATIAAVVGVACIGNYAGAYINKYKAESELTELKNNSELARSKDCKNLEAVFDRKKEIPNFYIAKMKDKGFCDKILGNYDNYDKFKSNLR